MMIHKSYSGLILISLSLLIFSGCQKKEQDHQPDITKFQLKTIDVFEGWDMHIDNKSRTIPFLMREPDDQIGAWSTAGLSIVPGTAANVNLFQATGARFPTGALPAENTAAMKFTANKSFNRVAVSCPTYGSSTSNITISLYIWDTDYATTIATNPVASSDFVAFPDNSEVFLENGSGFSAGTYLWLLHRGSGTPAIWANEGAHADATSFLNGAPLLNNGNVSNYASYIRTADFSSAVTYQLSGDLAATWSAEQVTQGNFASPANGSVFLPNAANHANYYYLNYTVSLPEGDHHSNRLYLARSVSPLGPWQNWTGTSWGDTEPAGLFIPDAQDGKTIFRNDSVYVYYTADDKNTYVAADDATSLDWPKGLIQKKPVVNNADNSPVSFSDVKYADELKQFVAMSITQNNATQPAIVLWTSVDGIHFEKKENLISENIPPSTIAVKLIGDRSGFVSLRKIQYLYSQYVTESGVEKVKINPIRFRTETEIR